MNDAALIARTLKASPLLTGLSSNQLTELSAACSIREFSTGEIIAPAGPFGGNLLILAAGKAEILGSAIVPLGECADERIVLNPEQGLGEIFINPQSFDSATLHVLTTPTKFVVIPLCHLSETDTGQQIWPIVLHNSVSLTNISRLALSQQTSKICTLRRSSANLLMMMITLMFIILVTNQWLVLNPDIDVYSPRFAWAALTPMILLAGIVAWREKCPLETFGITPRYLGKDIKTSIAIVTAIVTLGGIALYAIGFPIMQHFQPDYLVRYGPAYTLHCALQELMVRGLLFGMLLRLFDSTTWYQRQLSNCAVSFVYGISHIFFGLGAVALTTVFSILLGSYFLVYRNLAGPILIHSAIGLTAFMFGII